MNRGKQFEQDFKNSFDKDTYIYRLRDSANSWSNNDNSRFTTTNICDFIIYKNPYLLLAELKETKGKSLTISRIRKNQYEGLKKAIGYQNMNPILVVLFSDINECYKLDWEYVVEFIEKAERKSIPIEYIRDKGTRIGIEQKRTRYRYTGVV